MEMTTEEFKKKMLNDIAYLIWYITSEDWAAAKLNCECKMWAFEEFIKYQESKEQKAL